jgi:hypothetical protein
MRTVAAQLNRVLLFKLAFKRWLMGKQRSLGSKCFQTCKESLIFKENKYTIFVSIHKIPNMQICGIIQRLFSIRP